MNHVLVVDDEAEIRNALEEILGEEGYGVATAATAAEAMVLLQDAHYDAVLLDIWLPDRDGLDVLSDIHGLATEIRPEWSSSAATAPLRLPSNHQAGRVRLPRETPFPRSHPHRPQERGGSAPPAHRKPRVQAPIQSGLCAHRRKRSLEGTAPADSPDGAHQWARAHLR